MDAIAFHDTVKKGDLAAVKSALAAEPALLTQRNAAGQSALLLAKYYRQPAIADYLLSLHPELDIYDACAAGDLPTLQRELNGNPNLLESHNSDGWTPLHLTVFFGQRHLAQTLLERGAQVDSRSTNRMRNTPLHAAAAGGETALVELLLENGADVNARQEGGWSALHAAAQSGNQSMVELLLQHGADPSVQATNNQTPLDLALLSGKAEVALLLERLSPVPDAKIQ